MQCSGLGEMLRPARRERRVVWPKQRSGTATTSTLAGLPQLLGWRRGSSTAHRSTTESSGRLRRPPNKPFRWPARALRLASCKCAQQPFGPRAVPFRRLGVMRWTSRPNPHRVSWCGGRHLEALRFCGCKSRMATVVLASVWSSELYGVRPRNRY